MGKHRVLTRNFLQDFPYAPSFTQVGSLAAVQESPLLTDAEKIALFTTNPETLFGSKINCTLTLQSCRVLSSAQLFTG